MRTDLYVAKYPLLSHRLHGINDGDSCDDNNVDGDTIYGIYETGGDYVIKSMVMMALMKSYPWSLFRGNYTNTCFPLANLFRPSHLE